MPHAVPEITFYLDFISPYAYLAFEELPKVLMGCSYQVNYKPILFASLLKHYGQLGPAEIPAKREWTYRQVLWQARERQIPFDLPAAHPFNPLGLLRLAIACSPDGLPNRYVCETMLRNVWCGGLEASDPQRLAELTERLQPSRSPDDDGVKAQLRRNGEDALAQGVFGVPSFAVGGQVFWGLDSLPMLRQYLDGDAWFENKNWANAGQLPAGVVRPR